MKIIAIENNLDQLWCRKSKQWINPEEFSAYALQSRCAFPTYLGCNQVAFRLAKDLRHWPKRWGNIHVRERESYNV